MSRLLEPTTPEAEPRWMPNTRARSTFDLVSTCVITLTLCVWSAIHLNIPSPHTRGSYWRRWLLRVSWMMMAVFTPEFVLWIAFQQFQEARAVCLQVRQPKIKESRGIQRELNRRHTLRDDTAQQMQFVPAHLHKTFRRWFPKDLEFGYYVVMGGYEIIDSGGNFMGTVTPLGALQLAREGLLPEVSTDLINDKSKADSLAKTLVCLQASWMLVQCIARKAAGIPITLLEINTVMHVVCALCMYLLWLKKPQH